ncbi:hypothetical protein BJG93_12735 [Paraburkholderia sprentiae WSM5005]|uniref:Uncharacterized protein n=1 Tax=Paraburkholderia sprentiae WSM5005 TaxID=754502 RepID=A0A1I9YIN5_9BURK|nr:hypothetical protein [Paraburkholderia sprentiae]APA86168.1 hypothetical protein BJG93_12735 [Paraburkholderia sprentiae WSM5005]
MQYLKNTLGGLSRSLTDSALHSFQGRHRWWKLALLAGLFVLPGGSLGVALLAWAEHRRMAKRARNDNAALAETSLSVLPEGSFAMETGNAVAATPNGGTACLATGGASCRASAGKLACRRQRQRQQFQSTESRP